MAKSPIVMLILTVFLVTTLVSFASADTTKLICLDNGETIEFSKCNSAIADRTCESTWGCQFGVTEKSSGVYCPQSINACNSLTLTCSGEQSDTESIETIPVTQNDEEDNSDTESNTDTEETQDTNTNTNNDQNTQTNTNSNTNSNTETNTQDNSQQTNNENIFSKLINRLKNNENQENNVSVKGTISAKTNFDKDNSITGNTIDNSKPRTTLNINPIFFLLVIGPIIEFIILSFLLGYVIGKKKLSLKNIKGNKSSQVKDIKNKIKEAVY